MKKAIVRTKLKPPLKNYHVKTDIFSGKCIGCGNISNITHPYCIQCFENMYHIRVKKTKDRGYGMFLLQSCKKDTLMMLYTGHIFARDDYDEIYEDNLDPDYGLEITGDKWIIDARSNFYSVARYINGTTSEHANLRFARTPEHLALRYGVSIYADKDIYVPKGKEVELMLDYGESYHGIREVMPRSYITPKGYKFPKWTILPCYQNTK